MSPEIIVGSIVEIITEPGQLYVVVRIDSLDSIIIRAIATRLAIPPVEDVAMAEIKLAH